MLNSPRVRTTDLRKRPSSGGSCDVDAAAFELPSWPLEATAAAISDRYSIDGRKAAQVDDFEIYVEASHVLQYSSSILCYIAHVLLEASLFHCLAGPNKVVATD